MILFSQLIMMSCSSARPLVLRVRTAISNLPSFRRRVTVLLPRWHLNGSALLASGSPQAPLL